MPTSLLPPAAWLRSLPLAAGCAVATLIASGCSSPRPSGHHARHEALQAPLAARADFFDGTLTVDAVVMPFHVGLSRPERGGAPSGRPERADSPRGGGMGPPPRGGGFSGPPGEHAFGAGASRGSPGGPVALLPRQTLRINFVNHGAAPVTFLVTTLESAIGNFAPQPAQLTLAPGASAALEPVSGDAGGPLAWLDVALALRRDGRGEHRLLHLVPTGDSAPPPPPVPPTR